MSFFIKTSKGKDSKQSKKITKKAPRGPCVSDVNPTQALELDDLWLLMEQGEDTCAMDSFSTDGGDLIAGTKGSECDQKQRIQQSKKKSKRSISFGGWSKMINKRKTDKKSGHETDELKEIESFVKQVAASGKGHKLLQDHLNASQSTLWKSCQDLGFGPVDEGGGPCS